MGCIYWAVALAATGPTILAEQLDNAKIFATDVAKTALSVAQITDLTSWVLLALASSLTGAGLPSAILSVISIAAFILFSGFYMRPVIEKMIEKTGEYGIDNDEYYFCTFVAVGVGIFGFFANSMGAHPVVGAFVFGLIIPRGALEVELFEKFEGFIMWILMPFFMVTVGQRVDIDSISSGSGWGIAIVVLVVAGLSKAIAAMVSSFITGMDFKESVPLGILMNTKSMFPIMALHIGFEHQVLSAQSFTIMVIGLLLMTISVAPFIVISGRKKQIPYKRRTIHKLRSKEELRILACLHSIQDIHSTVGLFDVSFPSQNSPIIAFAVHLILPHSFSGPSETDQIVAAFDKHVRQRENITISTFSIKSTYSIAEEDICDAAEERRANLVIIPFHKQQGSTGELEIVGPTREMNESVISNSPCSVGIFIDRGLAASGQFATRIAMIFVGGPDDREALAYAVRIAQNPAVKMKVTIFVPSETANQLQYKNRTDTAMAFDVENERDKDQDESAINKLKETITEEGAPPSTIALEEVVVDNEEQVIELIRGMDGQYDLFVVGKGGRHVSPLTSGLADWCEFPELGPIGDALVTTRFSSAFSVLVMQQYDPMGVLNLDRPSSSSTVMTKDELEPSTMDLKRAAEDGIDDGWFERR
ncbi:cation/H(+) antiporter 15-like [Impatiens glandulifera]|uniref:cation/H(+) antiporter 15-like n=1 Tax=Impatiens glandulifera TaxID=253017 RepID=UPI001FB07772|nr:cation/H(+) antiporter 15-like [Impatiens glandulifera]